MTAAAVLMGAVVAFLLVSPASLQAQGSVENKIVRDIEVQYIGAITISESRIRSNMRTKVGDRFSHPVLQGDVESLYATGDVQNIRMLSEPVGADGIRIIVVVQTRARLSEVSFIGHSAFRTSKLVGETDLKIGNIVDESAVQQGQRAIEDLYRDEGFSDVRVSYSIKPGSQDGFSRVVYTIDEGDRSVIDDILFEGNTVFTANELREEMELQEKSLWAIFTSAGKLDNNTLEDDIARIEEHYQNAGYLNARVTNVQKIRANEEKIDLVLTIFEGVKYDVASVGLNGTRVFSEAELIPALRLVPGDAYSAETIRKDVSTLGGYYGSRGYAAAQIIPEVTEADDSSLHVTYNVYEGDKFYLRRIDIDGNTKTQDQVIRRELKVTPGDEYNTVLLEKSQAVLHNLGYFSAVEFFPTDSEVAGFKDVNIAVSEKSTGQINLGAGFSSIDSIVGFLDISQSNFDLWNYPRFTGGGQKFRSSLKFGSERRDVLVSLTEPWFMGQKLALSGEVFYRDVFFLSDLYDQSTFGAAVSLRKPIGEHNSIRAEYRLQNIEIGNIDPSASPVIAAEAGDFVQSKLALDFLRDTRDSLFLTRSGHKLSVGTHLSGEVLGGNVDTYGISFEGEQHFSLPFDTILSFDGSLRFVDGTASGKSVPIFDRLFLGGANNLRGFDFREVGPKDVTGEPVGGQTAAFFSMEYTFPIFKDKVRGALFYDMGFVNASAYDFSASSYNSNWGLGLRLFLPVGPIRLDFGIPIEADAFNDSGGNFNFNLGYQF